MCEGYCGEGEEEVMKVKIETVYQEELDHHKEVLDKYKAVYYVENKNHHAVIEINDLSELFSLSEQLELRIIVRGLQKELIIYDDYIE